MTIYDELPDIEREILRLLYFAPDHTARMVDYAPKTYYLEHEIFDATIDLRRRGLLETAGIGTYRPSAEMLTQMRAKNEAADTTIQAVLSTAKPPGSRSPVRADRRRTGADDGD